MITPWPHGDRVVDAVVLAYIEWCEESAAVWETYERWAKAPVSDRAPASAAYGAALDREEAAARSYEEMILLDHSRSRLARELPVGPEVSGERRARSPAPE